MPEADKAAWVELGRQLAASRQAAGLSQHGLAALADYSRSTIANVETGRQHVPRRFWQSCDSALGTGTALARGYDDVIAVTRGRLVHDAAATQRSRILAHENHAGPVSSPAAPSEDGQPALDGLELVRLRLTAALEEGALSEETLEAWEQAALAHGAATRYKPTQDVLTVLGADLAELLATLRRCRAPSSLRRLARVTAQMSGLACLSVVRLDERKEFGCWAATARTAASQAGDSATMSWVLAQEAYGHFYAGHPTEAISAARRAQELMRKAPCVGAVTAAALEARAHAARGDPRETRLALARTEAILGRLAPQQMTRSAFGYTEAQFRFHESSAWTSLGQVGAAMAAQDRALELCQPDDYTDWALTRLDRAACLARQGDPLAAVEYAASTLGQLGTGQRQGLITVRATELAKALPPTYQSAPATRELRELLHASNSTETP
jgi:tetratricopeptide (TPR) repeat protein